MLHKFVQPGDTVYTILRHVSRSGMSRVISCYIKTDTGMQWLDGWIARVGIYRLDREREGLKIGGCGMDMGFAIVYDLSYQLFKDGFTCIGEGCPSNDHSNGDRNYEPHQHSDAGYALRHRWL